MKGKWFMLHKLCAGPLLVSLHDNAQIGIAAPDISSEHSEIASFQMKRLVKLGRLMSNVAEIVRANRSLFFRFLTKIVYSRFQYCRRD